MSLITTTAEIGKFLLDHPQLVEAAMDVLKSGAAPEEVEKAIRALKVEISDRIARDEFLGR